MALILSGDTGVPASGMPTGSVLSTTTSTLTTGQTLSVTNAGAWTSSSLTVTITPLTSTSKYIIFADIKYASNNLNSAYRIYDVTASTNVLATSSGSRLATEGGAIGGNGQPMGNGTFNTYGTTARTTVVYYSPASPSATRQFRIDFIGINGSGNVTVGANTDTTDASYNSYSPCTLTVLEIKA
jgi:hypothetical protein